MIAQWFDRSGFGQLVAPDSNADPVSENDESQSTFWNVVAPDPKFTPSTQPNVLTGPSSTSGTMNKSEKKVLCTHCKKLTNMKSIGPSPGTTAKELELDGLFTPSREKMNNPNDTMGDVNDRVLSACRDTSKYMRSPKLERKLNEKFLRICSSTKPITKKLETTLRKMIKKHPCLFRVRATKLGETAPDGYTSLQVAAYANHVVAAKIILESEEEYRNSTCDHTYSDLHLDRDFFGHTALHIAGERGHLEMIQLLLPYYRFPGSESLINLERQTAFGRAVTSPNPKAKKNQRTLEKALYSSNDLSLFGNPKSIEERMGSFKSLRLEYGTSEMPGRRGNMEDAMCIDTWYDEGDSGAKSQQIALFAICDGHGDNGDVSQFIASHVSSTIRDCISKIDNSSRADFTKVDYWNKIWHSACLQLDAKLKEKVMITGGSTAVFALITEHEIVVANVGDSRCILICENEKKATKEDTTADEDADDIDTDSDDNEPKSIEETLDDTPVTETSINESSEPPPTLLDESTIPSRDDSKKSRMVIALSYDHKPNLPDERKRINEAGLQVKDITFVENGKTKTIHKIVTDENDQLAVSRAFGDFDYKANKQLQANEQSVIPIADVRVHKRDPKKDLFLFLACDGIWDVMENHEVMDFVQRQVVIKSETSFNTILPDVADALLQQCLHRESRDNMSCILINVQPGVDTSPALHMPPKALNFESPKK
mmetsp:Transcript_22625/g.25220  ORF Transcript_22625/g.25220 Transcript_22625/m.25220 type:complete len:714 (+) Transcript_22625:85-2226(+)